MYLDFLKYVVRCCQGCIFKQLLQNNSLCTGIFAFSLSIVLLSLENSSSKASRLLFIFIRISTDHAHFPNDEIRIPWMPMSPSMVVFSSRMPEKLTRKRTSKSVSCCYTRFLIQKRNQPSRQKLTYALV